FCLLAPILVTIPTRRSSELIARSLRETAAYAVDVAADGEAGLNAIESNPYDAVILDLMLPKLDGMQVLERVRQSGRRTPILVLRSEEHTSELQSRVDIVRWL